jgi:hypothetical protein
VIRAVGNKRLDLSDSEFSYYKKIEETIGSQEFVGLFDTDKNGIIIGVTPPVDRTTNMAVIYFILNVMVNQRLRGLDLLIKQAEDFVDFGRMVPKIMERLERLEEKADGAAT